VPLYVLGPKHPQGEVLKALGEAFVLDWGEPTAGRLTYFDTFDWLLSRSGLTLSANRATSSVALTLTGAGEEKVKARAPRLPSFAETLPAGPLARRVQPITHIRRLLPQVRISWRAETAAVLNKDRKTVLRLEVGTGVARDPSSQESHPLPPTLRILPLKGYGKDAQRVASFLWRAFGLRGSRRGEMELALSSFGRTPGKELSAPRIQLDPGMKGAVAAKTIHRALLSIIQANETGLIQDLDSEFLHDFRVAIRKTRSALGQIKGVFPPRTLAHFEREFRWLGGRTGPTRDMDVYLLKIPSYQAALPGGVKDQLEPLVRFLERKKKLEHGRLVRTLRTERYARLIEDWTRFLSEPVPEGGESPNAHRPIIELASERIWKAYWKVLMGGEAAGEDAPAEALHRLRIDCKKLRYLLTFFQSLFPPKEMRSLINELKLLQDVLGDFNDIHVQRESLRRFADEMMETGVGPPETLMAMGRLMGQLETQQEIERGAFHERFRRFARGRNVSRFQKLFKVSSQPTREPIKGGDPR